MTPDEFIHWVQSLNTPFTFTDEDKEELLSNFNSVLNDK